MRYSVLRKIWIPSIIFIGILAIFSRFNPADPVIYLRFNQVGYLSKDYKTAIAFSNDKIRGHFKITDAQTGSVVFTAKPVLSRLNRWSSFKYFYTLDFSPLIVKGTYKISIATTQSGEFRIGDDAYQHDQEDLLGFMRQQRCGYNPFIDRVCHQRDGRTFYGPMPDSTYIDVSGGWHDAGDQLKYLITSSFATGAMLMAYEQEPKKFEDRVDALGHDVPDQLPDVLNEAKWGLDWIQKMHPKPDQLFHQVADDRDHIGWKWPDQDKSDYGWGPNSYRAVYFANGKPQGLKQYKSEATGIANIAGRSAAALALGYKILKAFPDQQPYAEKCLQAARELYEMGREKEGFQQGNSYGAPYRYMERTWADDMEWVAAELYGATGKPAYLEDAKKYADKIGQTSWLMLDSAAHYEYYPFINLGHYALYQYTDEKTKSKLAQYYRNGIEHCQQRASKNIYGVGVPFIWCSNNLVVSLVTQIKLYEKMTGDQQFNQLMIDNRDWLFGKNPWGTSMFMNIPRNGEFPVDVHTSIWALTKQEVPGGLVDGPIWRTIYSQLKGLTLLHPDEFAAFQNNYVVYHDDRGDYSTNEPTMDGTAGAVLMMAIPGE